MNEYIEAIYDAYLDGTLLEELKELDDNEIQNYQLIEAILYYKTWPFILDESFENTNFYYDIQEIQEILDEGIMDRIRNSNMGRKLMTAGRVLKRTTANVGTAIGGAFGGGGHGGIWTKKGRDNMANKFNKRAEADDNIWAARENVAQKAKETRDSMKAAKNDLKYRIRAAKASHDSNAVIALKQQKRDLKQNVNTQTSGGANSVGRTQADNNVIKQAKQYGKSLVRSATHSNDATNNVAAAQQKMKDAVQAQNDVSQKQHEIIKKVEEPQESSASTDSSTS